MKRILPHSVAPKALAFSVLILLWIVHSVINYVWIRKDAWYPITDSYAFFNTSSFLYEQSGSIMGIIKAAVKACTFRPPMVFLGPLPFFAIKSVSYQACLWPNYVYLLLLLISIYGIGEKMSGPWHGLLAAYMVSTYPEIISLSRIYLLDLPMVASMTLSVFMLMLTNQFRSRQYSILFGVSLGFAFLVKWTSLVFVLPCAIAWFFWPSASSTPKWPGMKQLQNLIISAIISLVAVSWWLLPNLKPVAAELYERSLGSEAVLYSTGAPFFHPKSLLYYPLVVLSQNIVFFLIFIVAFAVFLAAGRGNKQLRLEHTILLIVWFVVPFAIFTYSPKKCPRFVASFLPFLCLVSSAGLLSLGGKGLRRSVIATIVILCAVSLLSLTFGNPHSSRRIGRVFGNVQRVFRTGRYIYERVYAGNSSIDYFDLYARAFDTRDWRVKAILADVLKTEEGTEPVSLAVLSHHPFFHHGAFEYFAMQANLQRIAIKRFNWASEPIDDVVLASDYVVTKTGLKGESFAIREIELFLEKIRSHPEILLRNFHEISEYQLPDGSVAKLYKKARISAFGPN